MTINLSVVDKKAPTPTMIELGATGLRQYGGIIREEFLRQLQGLRAARAYREMADNDAVVSAMLFAIEMLARQVVWSVVPASQSGEDVARADFLESCMSDMSFSWDATISEILSFLPFGFSYHELVYKRRLGPMGSGKTRSKFSDGKIGWRKIPIRAQDTVFKWELDDKGGIQGLWQQTITDSHTIFIPIEKALLFRSTSHKNNPEGKSILRGAYRSWFFKKRIEEIESIGIERELAGLPVMKAPARIMDPNANTSDKAIYEELKTIVQRVRADEQAGLVIPSDRDESGNLLYDFVLLNTGGRRGINTEITIQRYSRQMAMTALADFILIGHERVGSFALSSSKTNMFAVALGSFLDEIQTIFNTHAVPRLFAMNNDEAEELPQITHGDIETMSLTELATSMKDFFAAGFDMSDVEDWVRTRAGMPERVGDDEDGADGTISPRDKLDSTGGSGEEDGDGSANNATGGQQSASAGS